MASSNDPTKPIAGVSADQADRRANLQSAKDEIGALQVTEPRAGHQRVLGDPSASGALARVDPDDISGAAVTAAKIAVDAAGADQLRDDFPISTYEQQLTRPQLKHFSETSPKPAISVASLTVDLETFAVVWTEDVTSLIVASPPAAGCARSATPPLKRNAPDGRTMISPCAVLWSGTPRIANLLANALDVHALKKLSGGPNWFDFRGERVSS